MDTERWLPVPGYEGLYDVSDLGNVRSLCKSKRPRKNGDLLAPAISAGHWQVALYRDKKSRSWPVHQLVLAAFAGPRPPSMQSLHGPGGNLDNRLSNLSYGTSKQNKADQVRDGVANRGERGGNVKLTEAIVLECRRRYAAGETQTALAAEFGIRPSSMSQVITGDTWAHVPGAVPVDHARHGCKGTQHHAAKLTAAQVTEIRDRYRRGIAGRRGSLARTSGTNQYELAAEYGVSQAVIGKIVTGKSWTHLL